MLGCQSRAIKKNTNHSPSLAPSGAFLNLNGVNMNNLFKYSTSSRYWIKDINGSKLLFDVTRYIMREEPLPNGLDNDNYYEIVVI